MSLLLKTNGFASVYTAEVANTCEGMYQEAAEDSLAIDRVFDIRMMKLDSFTEAVDRELSINMAKAELKCMMEDGTEADLAYLEEAAEEGALAKFKKMIQAVIDAFKEWVSQKKSKVISKIASKEARLVLGKAEKKVKINPILARKKVQVMSSKKPLGVINSYKSKNDKVLAKTVKGIISESTMKTIGDTKESFREDFKNSISGTTAYVTVTVAALLAELNSEIDKLPSYVDKMEGSTSQALERLKTTCTEEAASAATAATNAAANFGAELAKEEINVVVDSIMNKMSVLKNQVLHAKDTEINNVKPVKESADDFDSDELSDTFFGGTASVFEEDAFEESADDSVDAMLEEIFGSSSSYAESAEDVGGFSMDDELGEFNF